MRSTRLAALAGAVALGLAVNGTAADDNKLKVKEGQPMPDVTLPATQPEKALPDAKGAKSLSLKELKGKKNVVLFFFPKAMTKGWTIESCGFRDEIAKFAAADTVVIGISTDNLATQQKFTEKENLNYPLMADEGAKVSRMLGVMLNDKLAKRITFVIDKQGKIAKIYEKVSPAGHPEEVLKFVKEHLNK